MLSRYITKTMHLDLPKRPTIWNGGSMLQHEVELKLYHIPYSVMGCHLFFYSFLAIFMLLSFPFCNPYICSSNIILQQPNNLLGSNLAPLRDFDFSQLLQTQSATKYNPPVAPSNLPGISMQEVI